MEKFTYLIMINISSYKNILIVCGDIGGAEIISSFVIEKKIKFKSYFSKKASLIFKKKKIKNKIINYENIRKNPYKFDLLITGTGWDSKYDREALYIFRNIEIKKISFLDHWANYKTKFYYKGLNTYPSDIITSDKYSFNIAKKTFKNFNIKIHKIKNYFISQTKANYKTKKKKLINSNSFLFIDEQNSKHYKFQRHSIYNEKKVLDFFIKKLFQKYNNNFELIIRIHPNDKINKYDNFLKEKNIKISNNKELIDDLIYVKYVVGISSMALYVAERLGKLIVYALPKKNLKHSKLPIKDKFLFIANLK